VPRGYAALVWVSSSGDVAMVPLRFSRPLRRPGKLADYSAIYSDNPCNGVPILLAPSPSRTLYSGARTGPRGQFGKPTPGLSAWPMLHEGQIQ